MKLDYVVVDVFTTEQFGGNPLAVVLGADALSTEQMQTIAREFNFSETSFVLKPKAPENTAHVRIFTPSIEMPFAGHPNVGTSYVLALFAADRPQQMRFEEMAGLVTVNATYQDGTPVRTAITAPEALSLGEEFDIEDVAAALSLTPGDIVTDNHQPVLASVGAQFIIVEIASRAALKQAIIKPEAARAMADHPKFGAIYLYTRDGDPEVDWNARMFSFRGDTREDPATGSATGACAALQHHLGINPRDGTHYLAHQGVDMGRPSELVLKMVDTDAGPRIEIAGSSVLVMKGELFLEE